MEVYSSNTSDVVRGDFLKFSRRGASAPAKKEMEKNEVKLRKSLEELRAEMAKDDGRGSYSTYKCPIF